MSAVYQINKAVNRPLEFKGVRGSFILYLGVGLVLLFLLAAILFTAGCNSYLILGIILPAGALLFLFGSRLSKRFGEHGLLKKLAKQQLPKCVASKTWKMFFLSGK
jgi:hypothetical protein